MCPPAPERKAGRKKEGGRGHWRKQRREQKKQQLAGVPLLDLDVFKLSVGLGRLDQPRVARHGTQRTGPRALLLYFFHPLETAGFQTATRGNKSHAVLETASAALALPPPQPATRCAANAPRVGAVSPSASLSS